MNYSVNRAMVIGSGVMGAGIAAHLANAGIPVYLIDIVPTKLTPEEEEKGLTLENPGVRNRIVNQGLAFLKKSKPAGLYSKSKLDLITAGNMEDNFDWAREADLIIEVVIENLEIKREVMATVDKLRKEKNIIATNTSGIPIHRIAEGRSEGFKAHFLGTHFFNPPRYLKLLELIPTPETDPAVIEFMKAFGERRLGKTVVPCKDTPNFIANRVAVVTGRATLNHVLENKYSIEEVDAITGPLIGHPKTATFRLLDLVGMDVNKHVSANLYEAIAHDEFREYLGGPGNDLTEKMVKAGLLGNKASQGFYKKVKGPDGKKTYRVLDLATLEYRDQQKPDIPILKKAGKIENLGERMRFLISQQDRFGEFIWHDAALALSYCSHLIPEIADALFSIDDAVRAGFSHEMGPFELWDALGVGDTIARMEAEGFTVAPWVKEMIDTGAETFYRKEGNRTLYWDLLARSYQPLPIDPRVLPLAKHKEAAGVIAENPSASLIDLGDGVLCLEFHSKANSLDQDIQAMCDRALDELEGAYRGLVIGNQGKNFSVGANVFTVVMAAENKQWDVIEGAIKTMQDQMLKLRYSPKPVVAAPFGMTFGGGAEICLAADRICASAETYMGLVEVGVGLIPAGGGCREMIKRLVSPAMSVATTDALPFLMKAFENIAMAKVGTSAFEAREMGFLTENDRIIMNADHLLSEAKHLVIEMDEAGYVPPPRAKSVYALGARGMAFLMQVAQSMFWSNYISEYDKYIAQKLAYVLSGGPLSAPQWVHEQYILDLEREAFVSLCGETKTIERIKHMLTTGKPLRN